MGLCRLCFNESEDVISIFSEYGQSLNIASVLSDHFWFKIVENNGVTTLICLSCWSATLNFDVFYRNVKQAQDSYFKTSPFVQFEKEELSSQRIVIKVEPTLEFTTLIQGTNEDVNAEHPKQIEPIECKSETDSDDSFHPAGVDSDSDSEENSIVRTPAQVPVPKPIKKIDSDVEESTDDDSEEELPKRHKRGARGKLKRTRKATSIKVKNVKNVEPTTNEDLLKKREKRIKDDEDIRRYCTMYCDMCTVASFDTFSDAVRHYKEAHNTRGYLRCCDRKMCRRNRVLDHIQRHINPNAHRCHICRHILSDRLSLKNHLDIHKTEDQKPFICDKCPNKYTKEALLARHTLQSHCSEEDKKFICDLCNKKFITKSQLTAHINRVHNPVREICDFCGKEFKCKYNLAVHRSEAHLGVESPKQQCNVCGVWLKEKYLPKHLKRHAADFETCKICSKVLQNKNSLGNHMRNVHGDRVHQCAICGKSFQKTISLREHMALHTGEDLYTCPYCPKTFKSGANMHSHRKKVHFSEWEQDRGKRLVFLKN